MSPSQSITVAIAEDHEINRKALKDLVMKLGFKISLDVAGSLDLLSKLTSLSSLPDVCILEFNVAQANGFSVLEKVKSKFPNLRVLVLTSFDNEFSIIRLIKKGADGFITKDASVDELQHALVEIHKNGSYHSGRYSSRIINLLHAKSESKKYEISEQDIKFMEYCCSDLSYQEIAEKMNLGKRTIEGYRDSIFQKLKVNSRVGIVLFALKTGLIALSELESKSVY